MVYVAVFIAFFRVFYVFFVHGILCERTVAIKPSAHLTIYREAVFLLLFDEIKIHMISKPEKI